MSRRQLGRAGLSLTVLTALLVLNVLPLLWGLLTSLKQSSDILRYPPTIFDFTPVPDQLCPRVPGRLRTQPAGQPGGHAGRSGAYPAGGGASGVCVRSRPLPAAPATLLNGRRVHPAGAGCVCPDHPVLHLVRPPGVEQHAVRIADDLCRLPGADGDLGDPQCHRRGPGGDRRGGHHRWLQADAGALAGGAAAVAPWDRRCRHPGVCRFVERDSWPVR